MELLDILEISNPPLISLKGTCGWPKSSISWLIHFHYELHRLYCLSAVLDICCMTNHPAHLDKCLTMSVTLFWSHTPRQILSQYWLMKFPPWTTAQWLSCTSSPNRLTPADIQFPQRGLLSDGEWTSEGTTDLLYNFILLTNNNIWHNDIKSVTDLSIGHKPRKALTLLLSHCGAKRWLHWYLAACWKCHPNPSGKLLKEENMG